MLDQNDPATAWMRFNTAVIPYEGNDDWVEKALFKAKETLLMTSYPSHAENCEHGKFLNHTAAAIEGNL